MGKNYHTEKVLRWRRSPDLLGPHFHPPAVQRLSLGYSSAARPARSVVAEGAGPLPFCSTKLPCLSHALPHPPNSTANTRQSSAQPNHCLFSEALARQTQLSHRQSPCPPRPLRIQNRASPKLSTSRRLKSPTHSNSGTDRGAGEPGRGLLGVGDCGRVLCIRLRDLPSRSHAQPKHNYIQSFLQ